MTASIVADEPAITFKAIKVLNKQLLNAKTRPERDSIYSKISQEKSNWSAHIAKHLAPKARPKIVINKHDVKGWMDECYNIYVIPVGLQWIGVRNDGQPDRRSKL